MAKDKKKHKKRKKKVYSYSVFAPVFPNKQGTPKTNYSSSNVNNSGVPGAGSASGPGPASYGGSPGGPGGGGGGPGMVSNILPPSRRRVIHEIRRVLSEVTPDPAWTGYSAPSPATVMRQGGPQVAGSGFQNVNPAKTDKYNFRQSPGLGFGSEKAWKVWGNIVDILTKKPTLPIFAVMQAAMARAGVRFGDIDPSEQRLLQMGIEWYLGNPQAQPKDSDGGGNTGFGAPQLNPVPM